MVHSTAYGGVLYSSLVENAALTTLVLMTELSLDDICDNLILSMRMQRPDCARGLVYHRLVRGGFRNHCATGYCRCRRKNATDHETYHPESYLTPDTEC